MVVVAGRLVSQKYLEHRLCGAPKTTHTAQLTKARYQVMNQKVLTPIFLAALVVAAPLFATSATAAQVDGTLLLAADRDRDRDRIHVPDSARDRDRDRDRDRVDADRLQDRDRDRVKDSDEADQDRVRERTQEKDKVDR